MILSIIQASYSQSMSDPESSGVVAKEVESANFFSKFPIGCSYIHCFYYNVHTDT